MEKIGEYDGRWLMIIVNESINPNKIITAFFDRRVRKKSYENKS